MNKSQGSKKYKAYMMLLMCGFGWALSTILIKIFIGDIAPFHLMYGRFAFAFILVFLMKPKMLFKSSKKEALLSLALGGLVFLAYATGILSLKYTTASKAGFLIAMAVVIVPVLQLIIHKKRPNKWVVITATISITGLYLISGMDGIGFNLGDALALVSSFAYAIYILIVDRIAKDINEYTIVQFQLISMTVIAFIIAYFFEGIQVHLLVQGWIPIVLTGFFGTAMTLYFQVHAQREASPESVGLLLLSEPVFTFLMAILVLSEVVTQIGLIGALMITIAMVLAVVKKI